MSFDIVVLPEPVTPTKALNLFVNGFKLIPFSIFFSGFDGYENATFLKSISPTFTYDPSIFLISFACSFLTY